MGQSLNHEARLTQHQAEGFKLSVSAACRRMTADQILELADHLHAIIRKRRACCGALEVAAADARAGEPRSWERQL